MLLYLQCWQDHLSVSKKKSIVGFLEHFLCLTCFWDLFNWIWVFCFISVDKVINPCSTGLKGETIVLTQFWHLLLPHLPQHSWRKGVMWSTVALVVTGGFLGNAAPRSRAEPRVGNMLIQWQPHKVTSSDFVTGLRVGRSPSLVLTIFSCCKAEGIKANVQVSGLSCSVECWVCNPVQAHIFPYSSFPL